MCRFQTLRALQNGFQNILSPKGQSQDDDGPYEAVHDSPPQVPKLMRQVAVMGLLLGLALSGCLTEPDVTFEDDNPSYFVIEGVFQNNGTKALRLWLNITVPEMENLSFAFDVGSGEVVNASQEVLLGGKYRIRVTWQVEGERMQVAGKDVMYDSFSSGDSVTFDSSQCLSGSRYGVTSIAKYVSSDYGVLAPILHHGIESGTDWEECPRSEAASG